MWICGFLSYSEGRNLILLFSQKIYTHAHTYIYKITHINIIFIFLRVGCPMLWISRPFSWVPSEARNLRSTLKLSREVLSVIPINRPATNRWERGKRGLKTERSGMEGWGAEPGSCAAVGGGGGRVVGKEGANPKPRLGRDWVPERGGISQSGPRRHRAAEGEGWGFDCNVPRGRGRLLAAANGLSQPPAGCGLRASGTGFPTCCSRCLGSVSPAAGLSRSLSACFFTFRGLCPRPQSLSCLPSVGHSPGLQCPRREGWPRAQTYQERWRSRGPAQVSGAGRLESPPKRGALWLWGQVWQHYLGLGNPVCGEYWVRHTPVG